MKFNFNKQTSICIVLVLMLMNATKGQTIKGKVTDMYGKALPFASIKFGESKQGIISDLEGSFEFHFQPSIKFIVVSYTGFKDQQVQISAVKNYHHVILMNESYNLNEVVIVSDAPKIKRIINGAINNRNLNNPENIDWYSCNVYYKMTADVLMPDSILQNLQKDTSKAGKEDARIANQILNEQHIFMTETISKRTWEKPEKLQEQVIASRVSGFKKAIFTSFVTDVLPFHAYNDFITLNKTNFNNPISKGYWQRYHFKIADEIYQGKDTIWVINYSAKKSNQLSGTVFISSDGYAITNIIAKNYDEGLKKEINLEQQYMKTNDKWFPHQLNFTLKWEKIQMSETSFGVFLKGNSFIDSVNFEKNRNFKFDKAHTTKFLPGAVERNDSMWKKIRPVEMSSKEKLTYKFIDSVGEKAKLDNLSAIAEKLTEGKIPFKAIDLDLKRFYSYNPYEKHRLGLGIQTNEKVFKNVSIGGWFGYGTGDKNWKYGGFAEWYVDDLKEFVFKISYNKDLAEPGRLNIHKDLNKNYLKSFLLTRTDQIEEYAFTLKKKFGYLQTGLSVLKQTITPQYPYFLQQKTNLYNQFNAKEVSLNLRYAYAERTSPLFGRYFSTGTKYPVIYGNITAGKLESPEVNYVQAVGAISYQVPINRLGVEKFLLIIGRSLSDAPLPISKLFASNGFAGGDFSFYSFGGMQTVQPYEFYSDRFINFYWSHAFNWKLYQTKIAGRFSSSPFIAFNYNVLFGRLSNENAHHLIAFKVPEPAYHETGIMLNSILRYNYLNIAYLNFNAGCFMDLSEKRDLRFAMGLGIDL